jgi:hypothetical protein
LRETALHIFSFCRWPDETRSISEYFLKMNEPNLKAYNCDQVINGVRYVHNAFGYLREEGIPKYNLKQLWGADNRNDADQVVVLPELWSKL